MGADVSDMTHAINLIAARATSDSAPLMPIPDVEGEVDPPFIYWDSNSGPSQRKRPTTTTAETKRGQHPAASASPGASGSGHYGHVFAED